MVWLRLFQSTGAERYLEAAKRSIRYLKRTQNLSHRNAGVRGGIKGSYPIWGEYLPYHYPSWAANFFVTALMLELSCESKSDINQNQPDGAHDRA